MIKRDMLLSFALFGIAVVGAVPSSLLGGSSELALPLVAIAAGPVYWFRRLTRVLAVQLLVTIWLVEWIVTLAITHDMADMSNSEAVVVVVCFAVPLVVIGNFLIRDIGKLWSGKFD